MYRLVNPSDRQELSLRMLFHPVGEGVYLRACEADGFRGLVAALLDAPSYESADLQTRLVERLRLADDVMLLGQLQDRQVRVADRDGVETINIRSDEPFIRSLDRLGIVSLKPSELGLERGR
jgi:hypothetical protein